MLTVILDYLLPVLSYHVESFCSLSDMPTCWIVTSYCYCVLIHIM